MPLPRFSYLMPRLLHRNLSLPFLALPILGIYLSTLAPGLTWANHGSDGGDLITAAYTGGIPHPTGYPLYLLLARLFQFFPIGSLAYRTNLMSVLATVVSVVLIYGLVSKTLNARGLDHAWLPGLTAGFAFGLAPLVWSQAVITEVYALQAFLTALILYLYVTPFQRANLKSLDRIRGLVMGLAIGNHVTTLLMLPLVLILGDETDSGSNKSRSLDKRIAFSLIRRLVWLFIGLSIYLTLPLRALTDPPVNWGNPVTLKRFWWLVSGELYWSYYLQFDFNSILGRLQAWASLLLQQVGWLGLVLGVIGLILFFTRSHLYFATIWVSLAYSLFAIVYSSDDSYVYLIPVYISFAIWIGLGVGNALEKISSHGSVFLWGTAFLLTGYFAFRIPSYIPQVDASKDTRAEMFGAQVMSDVPRDALVFVTGDQAIFSLWYFHFALHQRPDLVIIAEELLHFDWYQKTLQDTYPLLDIPTPFPWAQNIINANPNHPACYVQYAEQPEIACK